MIAIFLPGYELRGQPAPCLWVFYRLLSSIKEPCLYIIGQEYLTPTESLLAEGRYEVTKDSQTQLGYSLPTPDLLDRHHFKFLRKELFNELLAQNDGNVTSAFRSFLTEEIPSLSHELWEVLSERSDIEAILTWTNCPSLSAAARRRDIPVMHLELGPLRSPVYHSTAYLDFTGVNGNTQAGTRYAEDRNAISSDFSMEELHRFFYISTDPVPPKSMELYDLGMPLQVEDDSNLIAYGNGFDNCTLLSHAKLKHLRKVLVRTHPGSQFSLKPSSFVHIDDSPNSLFFLQQCKKILTINSSVGLEALLLGIPIELKGDSSYAFVAAAESEEERARRMYFYLFAYLVPFNLITCPEYLRFRLSEPSSLKIIEYHMKYYAMQKTEIIETQRARIEEQQTRIEKLCSELLSKDQTISAFRVEIEQNQHEIRAYSEQLQLERSRLATLLTSRSWHLTSPLRLIRQLLAPGGIINFRRRTYNGFRYILRGDLKGFVNRLKAMRSD
ncbi:MAG TPA: hypothetical protein VNT00_08335 [Eoetvoesiella sp.]|uniref:GT99 family glycosyltransferase N-terminal domain-containing protein n=1 Tax=Eoetvoesiella sp. TaxID=1966355 RepID=UPI002D0E9A22|nr:hypothetical protein [Eoetvoesiella sp.]HWK61412.1 hypothetical protein [Eoetvoesiella sp.]